ncbi:MAG: helix-turn-helix domain-containing protein [Solirubrobacterales bacterium]
MKILTPLEKRIQKLFAAVIPAESIDVSRAETDGFHVELVLKTQSVTLRALWTGEGWPDDVRRVFATESADSELEVVVLARRLAPGSLEIIRDLGVSWADETGAAEIQTDRLTVMRDGTSLPTETPKHSAEFDWSNSAVDIGEMVLSLAEERPLRVGEISETTGWSIPQVSNVLRAFEHQGWVQSTGAERGRGARRTIADRMGLLYAWSDQIAERPVDRLFAHAMMNDLMAYLRTELMPKLNQSSRWALTGWAAGSLIAPITSSVPSLQIYVAEDRFGPGLIRELGLTAVEEGGAVEIRSAGHVPLLLAHRTEDHLLVASSARVFADLKALGGRGEDAATHLLASAYAPSTYLRDSSDLDDEGETRLSKWEQDSRNRLAQRMREFQPDERPMQYRNGSWTSSYILRGINRHLDVRELRDLLATVRDQSAGWPPWLVTDIPDSKPYPIDDVIECWLMAGRAHDSDFWRARTDGSMFVLKTFDEDAPREDTDPGTVMSLTLPIWRTGECLMHAQRTATALGAEQIDFMMRWEGIRGRELQSVRSRNRWMPPGRICTQNMVSTAVRTTPAELETDLSNVVQSLVAPLFMAFDFFRPPDSIYDEELDVLRDRAG